MSQTKIMTELDKLLKENEERYYLDGILNKAQVIEDLYNYEPELITLLSESEIVRKHFLIEINGNKIIKINDLIEIFEMNEYWDDSYTAYENKIGLSSNGKLLSENNDVVLDFPYKDTILKASMSKEEREKEDLLPEEPFWNENIAREEIDTLFDKKVLINAIKYDEEGGHEVRGFSEKDNLIIKGNNLISLHTLKDKYKGKVKLIYIDPPYNTGNDSFQYNDRFNQSAWLIFMKNRLEISKELLKETGVIVIQCDNNEQAYLKVLMDEIFRKENFVSNISVKMSTLSGVKTSHKDRTILKEAEYLLVYSNNKEKLKIKPQYKPTNDISSEFSYYLERNNSDNPKKWEIKNLRQVLKDNNLKYDFQNNDTLKFIEKNSNNIWRRAFIRNKFKKISQDNPDDIIKNIDNEGNEHLYYRGRELFFLNQKYNTTFTEALGYKKENSELIGDIWNDINISRLFNEGGITLNNGKKPEFLIARLLDMFTKKNDLVLDYFMGSGTTQAVAHKMNRRYIGIEQMDYIKNLSIQRLNNVVKGDNSGISKGIDWQGGGSFIYAELMEKNTGYLKDVLDAESTDRLREVFNLMLEHADFDFRVDLDEVKESVWRLPLEDQKRTLVKIIDKNQLYYNYSEIDDENVRDLISSSDYAFNKSFYDNTGDEDE